MKALLLQLAIAFFTPFVTAAYKKIAAAASDLLPKLIGKLPPNTIPLFNAGLGGVVEVLAPLLGTDLPAGTGILSGLAAGGLRDIVMDGGKRAKEVVEKAKK